MIVLITSRSATAGRGLRADRSGNGLVRPISFPGKKGGHMKLNSKALLAAAGVFALSWSPAHALEPGQAAQTKAGVLIGASAGVPPPGIYMINQVFTYQANLTGP